MKRIKFWYIKERNNPQLGVYYVGEGQLSKTSAKRHESAIYGSNIMHEYHSEADYKAKLRELKNLGRSVQ